MAQDWLICLISKTHSSEVKFSGRSSRVSLDIVLIVVCHRERCQPGILLRRFGGFFRDVLSFRRRLAKHPVMTILYRRLSIDCVISRLTGTKFVSRECTLGEGLNE